MMEQQEMRSVVKCHFSFTRVANRHYHSKDFQFSISSALLKLQNPEQCNELFEVSYQTSIDRCEKVSKP